MRGQHGGRGASVKGCAIAGLAAAALGALAPSVSAQTAHAPVPDANFAVDLAPRPCALEGRDRYTREHYRTEGWPGPDYERYPGNCRRLRFSVGPITVKPGQNDVLAQPLTIEKPTREGFVTRIEPNLVRADGTVPPIDQVHLHHGTWLAVPDYGVGPFFAAGEEKSVFSYPKGYGMPVKPSDSWSLLYMVHSAIQQPMEVYITYDVDFVAKADGERIGMKPAYPLWWDVRWQSFYPVFNVQRGFGGPDGRCTWPAEQCAAHDPFGREFVGQGQPGNGKGKDWEFPSEDLQLGLIDKFKGGTIIWAVGHLHPGGLQNTIDLVRPGNTVRVKKKVRRKGKKPRTKYVTVKKEQARIYTGEAVYWDRKDPSKGGGPPTSWDFSMTVNRSPTWGVHVKPGDIIRNNAVYDTRHQSTYENMGIVVAMLVPNGPDGKPQAPGVDPFTTPRDSSDGCRSGGLRARKPKLCDRGTVTHGHLAENDNFGGAEGKWNFRTGPQTGRVDIADFLYVPGDLSMIAMTGVPTVKMGSELTFTNVDSPAVYHTVTSCKFPCLGPTGTAFPLADGRTSKGRDLDFDSSELGFGIPDFAPVRNSANWNLPVDEASGFEPGEIVTYYCRVHPGMRGAFEVQR